MQKLLTIVVPVYKVEKYINKCLDSCILYKNDGSLDEEKMNQLEVIIVNDGTPDQSAELSRVYTVRYPQTFRQIDKENGGHGSAWNVGLKEASGKYLRFLDSDDWLTNLDKLMEKLGETDADLVFTHRNTFYAEQGENLLTSAGAEFNVIKSIADIDISAFSWDARFASFMTCTYKTSMLKHRHPLFRERVRYDDSILFVAPLTLARTYICFDLVIYNYFIGRQEQSMNIQNQVKSIDQRYEALVQVYKWTKEQNSGICPISILCHIVDATYMDFFQTLLFCPYNNIKHYLPLILLMESEYIRTHQCKSYRRFRVLPLSLAWFLERIRQYIR